MFGNFQAIFKFGDGRMDGWDWQLPILWTFVQVTQEFIQTERLFNKPELSFGYFVVYTPVR